MPVITTSGGNEPEGIGGMVLAGGAPPPPPTGDGYAVAAVAATATAAGSATGPLPGGHGSAAAPVTAAQASTGHATPPPPPSGDHVTIWVVSDVQVNTNVTWVQARVNALGSWLAAQQANWDVLCMLGDETNDHNAAEFKIFQDNYAQFKPSFTGRLRPVHGSDNTTGGHVPYDLSSVAPYNWVTQLGTPPTGRESWAFTLGGWLILMAKSDPNLASASDPDWVYLENQIKTHPGMPTILMSHVPRWDAGSRHQSNNQPVQQAVLNMLHTYPQVELVVHGHIHQYHRYPRMAADGTTDTVNGIRELCCTNGGQGPPSPGYVFRAQNPSTAPNPQIIGDGMNLGAIELRLYSDHYEWQTRFHPSYSQQVGVVTGTGTAATIGSHQNGDSGTQAIR